MTPESISCIVPAYNAARYLGEAVDSILCQSRAPSEVVVVDDGSTDATAEVAARYPPPVRVLRQPNRGQAAACNAGIAASRGHYLAFLDADDLWEPDKLALQMARFEARPELDYCLTHIRNFLSPDHVQAGAAHAELDREYVGHVRPTLVARRGLFESVGLFDVSLGHASDTDWFVRARSRGALFEVVPRVLVRRRIHLDNRSQQLGALSRAEYLRLVKRVLDARREAGRSATDP